MKRYLLLLSFFVAVQCFAQQAPKIDQSSVVKNDDGMILPYPIWQKMMQSGEYSLRMNDKSIFTIHKLTPEEMALAKERRLAFAKNMPKPRSSEAFPEGKSFNGEKMRTMDGKKYDLRKADGKVYVLNFWFINCAPCKKEIPELNEIVNRYKDNHDVVFIAIALDQYPDLKNFLKTTPFLYNVVDDGRYYATKYGVKGYPTHVVIGKDGQVKFSTLGLAPNTIEWVEKTIANELKAANN